MARMISYIYSSPETVDFTKMSELVFGCLQPTSATDLTLVFITGSWSGFDTAADYAHAAGKKCLMQLYAPYAGDYTNYNKIYSDSTVQAAFIAQLYNLLIAHPKCDGIAFDWECSNRGINEEHTLAQVTTFYANLYAQINPLGKVISATENYGTVTMTSTGQNYLEWIGLMVYDLGAPLWCGTQSQFESDCNRWLGAGFSASKLFPGIIWAALYNNVWGNSTTYGALMAAHSPDPDLNELNGYYYNGLTLAQSKADFVVNAGLGGVFFYNWGQDASGSYSHVNAINTIFTGAEPPPPPPGGSGSDTSAPGQSSDDINIVWTGSAWDEWYGSPEQYFGYVSAAAFKCGGGFRFPDVAIPVGATITSAHITFTAKESNSNATVNLRITGEDADNAATFSTLANFQSRRGTVVGGATDANITSAQVDWDAVASWTAETTYDTPNIATIIQEIVDRAGWASGNAMVLYVDDFDGRSTVSANRYRQAYAFDAAPSKAPELYIAYGTDAATPITSILVLSGYAPTVTGSSSLVKYEHNEPGTYVGYLNSLDQNFLGQTFTPTITHNIWAVWLPCLCLSPGVINATIGIYATTGNPPVPTGSALGGTNTSFALSSLPSTYATGWLTGYYFPLAGTTQLDAGTTYAWVLKNSSGSYPAVLSTYYIQDQVYAGNMLLTNDGGVNWTSTTVSDFIFQEWGQPVDADVVVTPATLALILTRYTLWGSAQITTLLASLGLTAYEPTVTGPVRWNRKFWHVPGNPDRPRRRR